MKHVPGFVSANILFIVVFSGQVVCYSRAVAEAWQRRQQ